MRGRAHLLDIAAVDEMVLETDHLRLCADYDYAFAALDPQVFDDGERVTAEECVRCRDNESRPEILASLVVPAT